MEQRLVADLALIHAWKGDAEGNRVYRKTARNFNSVMVTAANVAVAEVKSLVENEEIGADHIHRFCRKVFSSVRNVGKYSYGFLVGDLYSWVFLTRAAFNNQKFSPNNAD
jgi:hypothetical protein